MKTAEVLKTEFNVQRIRADFPILNEVVRGKPLVYLDNAATTQKPRCVIEAVERFYRQQNSNVHRGVHYLSELATEVYEEARGAVRSFLNARSGKEIIFTAGATDSINLVAYAFGNLGLRPGDEILISEMEHHSNIVPWQMLCERSGAKLRVVPIDDAGELVFSEFERLLTPKTRLAALVYASNSLGTINPVEKIIARAHEMNVPVLLDAAQAGAHLPLDVQALDCDFLAFSGHKVMGPTGIGILYGKENWLDKLPPYRGGGDMIKSVTFEKTIYNDLPHKFEAGTPNIAGAAGLAAALQYVSAIGRETILSYENELLRKAVRALAEIPGLRFIGTAANKVAVISFVLEGVHPHDVGTILDSEGVAIRTGHHCTQPVMKHFNVPATSRASFSFYNTEEEISKLAESLQKVREFML